MLLQWWLSQESKPQITKAELDDRSLFTNRRQFGFVVVTAFTAKCEEQGMA